MLTAEVDLANQPRRTAACLVEWSDGEALVARLRCPVSDEELTEIRDWKADKTGVDVPLGWPDAFVRALRAHHSLEPWGNAPETERVYRETDREVCKLTHHPPLSVSTSWIAYPAMRLARLLTDVDRTGEGWLVEVYPAAALRVWKLDAIGYKRRVGRERLHALATQLRGRIPQLLANEDHWHTLMTDDNAFDALIAALVARAKALGWCERIPDGKLELAQVEGWIALPKADTLDHLVAGSRNG